jgi:hypothetical protein
MALDQQTWSAITNAYEAGDPAQAGILFKEYLSTIDDSGTRGEALVKFATLDMENTTRENKQKSAELDRELKQLKKQRPFWKRIFG